MLREVALHSPEQTNGKQITPALQYRFCLKNEFVKVVTNTRKDTATSLNNVVFIQRPAVCILQSCKICCCGSLSEGYVKPGSRKYLTAAGNSCVSGSTYF